MALYNWHTEAAKVIELRDKLLEQAESCKLADQAVASGLTPDLVKFSNRYQRLMLEKKIHKKRDHERVKNTHKNYGKLHLLDKEDLQEDEHYRERLKLALDVAPPSPATRPMPPPPTTILPYEDDLVKKPLQPPLPPPPPPPPPPAAANPITQNRIPNPNFAYNLPKPNASTYMALNQHQQQQSQFQMYSDYSPNMPEQQPVTYQQQQQRLLIGEQAQPSSSGSEYKPPVFNREAYIQTSQMPPAAATPPPVMMFSDDMPVANSQYYNNTNFVSKSRRRNLGPY